MIEKDEVDANKDSPTKSLGACRNFILAVAFYFTKDLSNYNKVVEVL